MAETGAYKNRFTPEGCIQAPAGRAVAGHGSCSTDACNAGTYSTGTGNTACTGCPSGHYQEDKAQTTCKPSCGWSHLYAYPTKSCSVRFDGTRDMTCATGFSGSSCEQIDERPVILGLGGIGI